MESEVATVAFFAVFLNLIFSSHKYSRTHPLSHTHTHTHPLSLSLSPPLSLHLSLFPPPLCLLCAMARARLQAPLASLLGQVALVTTVLATIITVSTFIGPLHVAAADAEVAVAPQDIPLEQLQQPGEVDGPIHFIWRVPHTNEREINDKPRVFTNGTLTGCCDGVVALALACALVSNPNTEVWLWSEQHWSDKLLRLRLVNSERLFFKRFVVSELAAGMPNIIEAFSEPIPTWKHQSVVWSDVARYLILNKHGGSYIDADICMARPLPRVPGPVFAQCPTRPQKNFIPCDKFGLGTIAEQDRCAYSTNGLFNLPKGYWLFNHTLSRIASQRSIVGKFFNVFGPLFLTSTAYHGMQDDGLRPPYVMRLRRDMKSTSFFTPSSDKADRDLFWTHKHAPLYHLTVNGGDFDAGSVGHRFFCHFVLSLNLTHAAGFRCDAWDKWIKPSHLTEESNPI